MWDFNGFTMAYGVLILLTLLFQALSPTWAKICISINKPPQMSFHVFSKGQDCQVADKYIDTIFTINIL